MKYTTKEQYVKNRIRYYNQLCKINDLEPDFLQLKKLKGIWIQEWMVKSGLAQQEVL